MPAASLAATSADLDGIDAALCAAVSGAPVCGVDPRALVELAVSEGLAPALATRSPQLDLPQPHRGVLNEEVRRQLALAAVREPELRRVLGAFADAGVDVLLIKGAHLAYTVYSSPALRPRNDTDLLVRPGDEHGARRVLASLGYQHLPAITGAAVQGQAIFEHDRIPGSILDVHWRLAAPIVAAELLAFETLWRRAQTIDALGPTARGPHLCDAVAIAAVHLYAHHPAERGLLWLNDVTLLTSALTEDQRRQVVRDARERRMTTLLASAVRRAEACFPSPANTWLLTELGADPSEPSAALISTLAPSGRVLMDVRALRTWKARTAYVAGHLFPPADYMRRRYAPASTAPLAWLYATRLILGARRWMRRSEARPS